MILYLSLKCMAKTDQSNLMDALADLFFTEIVLRRFKRDACAVLNFKESQSFSN